MLEKIQEFIKKLATSLQVAKIYTVGHPKFKESVRDAFGLLNQILEEKKELILGIVGDEFVFEREIFFDLSKRLKIFIDYLKKQNIEKIIFKYGLKEEEFVKFIDILSLPLEDKDIPKYLLATGIRNISIDTLKILESKKVIETSYGEIYKEVDEKFSYYIEKILDHQEIDLINLKISFLNLIDNSLANFNDFFKISIVKRYEAETYFHLLDVAILSAYFSYKLSFKEDVVKDIAIAGLFHDIGKIYISKKIISKSSKLLDEEYKEIKNHSILGAKILLSYTKTLGILPIIVAFEHHIGFDNSGYPKVDNNYKVSYASLIVSICDIYSALIGRRKYKREYPPILVYNFMKKKSGSFFEPDLLDKFFKIIGVWPINTIVRLSDESIAIVREENEDDIFSPKVEVIYPKKDRIIDLKENKDIKIKDFLSPYLEGAKYIDLI